MIKKYNISKPEKYTDKNGNEKTMWHQCGTMTEFIKQDGSVSGIIEIPAIGLKANVFPVLPKNDGQSMQQNNQSVQNIANNFGGEVVPQNQINPEEIPF